MGLRRVSAGEKVKIQANTWNGLIGMLEKNNTVGGSASDRLDLLHCTVQNISTEDIPWLGVIGITIPTVLPDDDLGEYLDKFAFNGVAPRGTFYQYKWGIAQEPIAQNEFGTVRVAGFSHCWISLTEDKHIDFAGPDPTTGDVEALVQADCGARVWYRAAGTGPQRAIVIL